MPRHSKKKKEMPDSPIVATAQLRCEAELKIFKFPAEIDPKQTSLPRGDIKSIFKFPAQVGLLTSFFFFFF